MTLEDEELLLKDLCARLPYGVYVHADGMGNYKLSSIELYKGNIIIKINEEELFYHLYEIKPYLRPLSSMTKEERDDWYRQSRVDYDCEFKPEPTLSIEHCHLSVDWLNKRGFDYRGLIPMGLALPAPEGMYKTD